MTRNLLHAGLLQSGVERREVVETGEVAAACFVDLTLVKQSDVDCVRGALDERCGSGSAVNSTFDHAWSRILVSIGEPVSRLECGR